MIPRESFDFLKEDVSKNAYWTLHSLPLAAQAWLALNIQHHCDHPLIWVLDSPHSLDLFFKNLDTLSSGQDTLFGYYPARETNISGQTINASAEIEQIGDRLKILQRCEQGQQPHIIATCIQAVLQPTTRPEAIRTHIHHLTLNDEIDVDHLTTQLQKEAGYSFEPEVIYPGHASLRGGILDIWPPAEEWPIRLEFFGSTLDSIRTFDPREQRSVDRLKSVMLSPAFEENTDNTLAFDFPEYLKSDTLWAWSEPDAIEQHIQLLVRESSASPPEKTNSLPDIIQLLHQRFSGKHLLIGHTTLSHTIHCEIDLLPFNDGLPHLDNTMLHPDLMEEERKKLILRLVDQSHRGQHVMLFFDTDGSRERFKELYDKRFKKRRNIGYKTGSLTEGFEVPSRKLIIIAESDLYGYRKRTPGRYEWGSKKRRAAIHAGSPIHAWQDMQPGEFVVHQEHGIGKYLGLYEIEVNGQMQEVLTIEYADNAKLYVPVSHTHLLSRYIGFGKHHPRLHRIGGKRWKTEKQHAEKAIQDLAAGLLETQATRNTLPGHAFAPDTPWQHEFEAAFPYRETEDQQKAIDSVKQDMENSRPMDRLICGDVGYGKTEVAMRAAFKTVMEGKQVAMIVPTTILAQQHYETFSERMAAYPIATEMLSRFRTRGEQAMIIEKLKAGHLDIVIGTHRLLQKDIAFKDLGLVIIDEEQRFGVEHKEYLKTMRRLVEILTLTATPIPRTLYMSLTGARDLSTIETPPQERLPIETIVTQYDETIIRKAILHELSRGGQVFFLHNRVKTIEKTTQRLQSLIPEARFAFGHGQMHEHELASVMHQFVRGEFDVLVCTTIIESGVDIPNVNTILIDRADRFGMADLYQLRGRVGRYKHQAYAYLLLPRHGQLFDTARQRVNAIRRYSSLGAGFKLALRDLEIRGAGNVLGSEQSGHIAAVGFDMYCQLLKRTIAHMKGETLPLVVNVDINFDFIDHAPGTVSDHLAAIPGEYIEDENHRINAYRSLASSSSLKDIIHIEETFRDRYGPIPEPLRRLLMISRIRVLAAQQQIQSIEVKDKKIMMMRNGHYIMQNNRFPRLSDTDTTKRIEEIMRLLE